MRTWVSMWSVGLAVVVSVPAAQTDGGAAAQDASIEVQAVRRAFWNGEHNAFTDLVKWRESIWLTFRSCPEGHMVYPSSSIIVLRSDDEGRTWSQVHRFSVAKRDTRDPHFLVFKGKLHVYTGTWYCGDTPPALAEYDVNKHLGYAAFTADGTTWEGPLALEGTYGHYIWRAAAFGDTAYLCARRKRDHAEGSGEAPSAMQTALLESHDGLVWRFRSLVAERNGDETAFVFQTDGRLLMVMRAIEGPAVFGVSSPPYLRWRQMAMAHNLGGPTVAFWGDRLLTGGRVFAGEEPRTALFWLDDQGGISRAADLPSGGDCSYPGIVALSPRRALVSWYSSHERDDQGKAITAIYTAELVRP